MLNHISNFLDYNKSWNFQLMGLQWEFKKFWNRCLLCLISVNNARNPSVLGHAKWHNLVIEKWSKYLRAIIKAASFATSSPGRRFESNCFLHQLIKGCRSQPSWSLFLDRGSSNNYPEQIQSFKLTEFNFVKEILISYTFFPL